MRLTRILVVALLAVQTAVAQAGSYPIRVRVTGVARYEIPDVIAIEENRISGRPVTLTPSMVRFRRTDGDPVISVLRPGYRVTGEARAVEGNLLEFISDDDQEVSHIPTDSIAVLERQESRTSRENATGIGIAAGAGIFGLSYFGALSCQPDEHAEGPCWRFFEILMFVGAPVVGVLLGWSIGRVRWERVTINELSAEFATVVRP